MKRRSASAGIALVTAIIFLVLLTLVALVTIKGTGLELRSSNNSTLRTEAFESSELPRTLVSSLIDVLCFNAGWPVAIGGNVPDADFNFAYPTGLTISDNDGDGAPDYWCDRVETPFDPTALANDATYRLNYPSLATTPANDDVSLSGDVAVYRLYVSGAPGSGQAGSAGYSPPGVSIASGGGNIFFYVQSRGHDRDVNSQANYNTSAAYRYVIRR